jgi:hypothetical protein
MSKDIDFIALPEYPREVYEQHKLFEEKGIVTQTHVIVTWVVADEAGIPLFVRKKTDFICSSANGTSPLGTVNYDNLTVVPLPEEKSVEERFRAIFGNISKIMDVRKLDNPDIHKGAHLLVTFEFDSTNAGQIQKEIESFKKYVDLSNKFRIISINTDNLVCTSLVKEIS